MSSSDTFFQKKYPFDELTEVGDSMVLPKDQVKEGNLRSAAAMWGTRYGKWLRVAKLADEAFKVTMVADPPRQHKKVRPQHRPPSVATLELQSTLQQHHEALRALTLLVLDLKKILLEKL